MNKFKQIYEETMVGAEDKAIKDMEAKLFQIKHELVDNNMMTQDQKVALRNELIKINTDLEKLVVKSKNPNLNEAEKDLDDMLEMDDEDLEEMALDAMSKKKVNESEFNPRFQSIATGMYRKAYQFKDKYEKQYDKDIKDADKMAKKMKSDAGVKMRKAKTEYGKMIKDADKYKREQEKLKKAKLTESKDGVVSVELKDYNDPKGVVKNAVTAHITFKSDGKTFKIKTPPKTKSKAKELVKDAKKRISDWSKHTGGGMLNFDKPWKRDN